MCGLLKSGMMITAGGGFVKMGKFGVKPDLDSGLRILFVKNAGKAENPSPFFIGIEDFSQPLSISFVGILLM